MDVGDTELVQEPNVRIGRAGCWSRGGTLGTFPEGCL